MHIVFTVFRRPFIQIALGIVVGTIVALILGHNSEPEVAFEDLRRAAIFVTSTTICCLLACIVPTRRALRIQPTQALKDDG